MKDGVLQALRAPQSLPALNLASWDSLIAQLRATNLLARLACDLEAAGLIEAVPAAPRAHLQAVLVLARQQRIALRAELARVAGALAEVGLPLLLLKGAAYAAADLPCARGRLFGDIDLLVPRARLADAESILLRHGWHGSARSAYDEKYYRRWMHELPPLTHVRRGSVLDVHHNILPSTARRVPSAALLLEAACALPDQPGVQVLAPADMVLHSACHLFHEGELDNGLRDLADLDLLLRHFGREPGFWAALPARATALGLQAPLGNALALCLELLATPVPAPLVAALQPSLGPRSYRVLMRALWRRALLPRHAHTEDAWTPLARAVLYLRAHWLRMPPHLLALHLSRKAAMRWAGMDEDAPPAGAARR